MVTAPRVLLVGLAILVSYFLGKYLARFIGVWALVPFGVFSLLFALLIGSGIVISLLGWWREMRTKKR
jgi:hypothetical protein